MAAKTMPFMFPIVLPEPSMDPGPFKVYRERLLLTESVHEFTCELTLFGKDAGTGGSQGE